MEPVTWTSLGLAGAGAGVVALAVVRSAHRGILAVVGAASIVSGLMGLAGAPLSVVWMAFLIVAVVAGVVAWRWLALLSEGSRLPPGAGATRLVGMPGLVQVDVPGHSSARRAEADGGPRAVVSGRVRVGGEVWRAETPDDRSLPSGSAVVVTGVRGARLVVTAAPAIDASVPPPPPTPVTRET